MCTCIFTCINNLRYGFMCLQCALILVIARYLFYRFAVNFCERRCQLQILCSAEVELVMVTGSLNQ